jgi:hypothetical protein
MESGLLKLFTQVGFVALVAFVVASAVESHEAKTEKPKGCGHRKDVGGRWADGICEGELSQRAIFDPIVIAPYQV